jgi:hypothetical protein
VTSVHLFGRVEPVPKYYVRMYGAFEERSRSEDVVRERFEEDDGIMILAFDPTHGRVTLLVGERRIAAERPRVGA